ncbi:hypothetical protein EMIT0P100_10901 [Pseudomonas sp. IT-P100]
MERVYHTLESAQSPRLSRFI